MITSYVSPEGSLLYLSLVGPLDRGARDDLLLEFDERVRDRQLEQAISFAESWNGRGGGSGRTSAWDCISSRKQLRGAEGSREDFPVAPRGRRSWQFDHDPANRNSYARSQFE